MIYETRVCRICGRTFRPRSGNQVCCSRDCSYLNDCRRASKRAAKISREQRALHGILHLHASNKVYHHTCIVCGKAFATHEPRSVCCSGRCVAAHLKQTSPYWEANRKTAGRKPTAITLSEARAVRDVMRRPPIDRYPDSAAWTPAQRALALRIEIEGEIEDGRIDALIRDMRRTVRNV